MRIKRERLTEQKQKKGTTDRKETKVKEETDKKCGNA